jgi:hypothetical protein
MALLENAQVTSAEPLIAFHVDFGISGLAPIS